ncbi:MAG: ABC transporter permease [Acidobacteriaceae bacterium]
MSILSGLRFRMRALFQRRALDEELEDELRFHFEREVEKHRRASLTEEEARRQARLAFGGQSQVAEDCREARGTSLLETLLRDAHYALRQMKRSPGFAVTAVLTLGLGIGATTALFSMVEGVLLAPLPYTQPDRLVMLWDSRPNLSREAISWPDFQDWQRNAHGFQQMAALTWEDFDAATPAGTRHINGMDVSSGFFSTLGVPMLMGQGFSRNEDEPHAAPEAILSYGFWKESFAANRGVLGKPVTLDGIDYTVVGVLPRGFAFWTRADVYAPLVQRWPRLYADRTVHAINSIARLQPGISMKQAEYELGTAQADLDHLYPAADQNLRVYVDSLRRELIGNTRGILLLLLGAVTLLLLIACANVANLTLVRAARRSREFAVRSALGASRARMVRQLMTESLLLASMGGLLGVGLAEVGLRLLPAMFGSDLPPTAKIGMNFPVLCFAWGVSVAAGMLFGVAPALKGARGDIESVLRAGGRGLAGGRSQAQNVLVAMQVGLTLVLLAGGALLLRTMRDLHKVKPGFDPNHLVTFQVGLSPVLTRTPADTETAFGQLLERIRGVPGVDAADVTQVVPMSGQDNSGPFWPGTDAPASMQAAPHALYFWTGPEYLRTMRIPLLRGRFFNAGDTAQSDRVVVINEVLARKFFPGRNPIGQTITVPHFGTARIVGVVAYVKVWGLDDPGNYNPGQIYLCLYQLRGLLVPNLSTFLTIVVRTPLKTAAILPAIKRVVYGAARGQTVYNVETMRQMISDSMAPQRTPLLLLTAFAAMALALASVGIYGTIAYSVARRVQEIGVRLALGARRQDVLMMVVGQGLRLAAVGLLAGAAAVLLLGRILLAFSRLLYGVKADDPETLIAVSLLLLAVTLMACYVPARRAARIDPMEALRIE